MAASRLFPLAIAGVVIAGAAAWLINDATGDETPVAAQPEVESDRTTEHRGIEAGSFQAPPQTAQPEAQANDATEPAAEKAPGAVAAVPGNAMLGVTPPSAPPSNPGSARVPTTIQEDALARSIDSATDAWSTRLKLDEIQKRGLRDAFEANALRQEELKQAAAGGSSKSDLLERGQELREVLIGDLQKVLTTTQMAEYESITGGSPDGR